MTIISITEISIKFILLLNISINWTSNIRSFIVISARTMIENRSVMPRIT